MAYTGAHICAHMHTHYSHMDTHQQDRALNENGPHRLT